MRSLRWQKETEDDGRSEAENPRGGEQIAFRSPRLQPGQRDRLEAIWRNAKSRRQTVAREELRKAAEQKRRKSVGSGERLGVRGAMTRGNIASKTPQTLDNGTTPKNVGPRTVMQHALSRQLLSSIVCCVPVLGEKKSEQRERRGWIVRLTACQDNDASTGPEQDAAVTPNWESQAQLLVAVKVHMLISG